MKKVLANFTKNILSRDEMKNVSGGTCCRVCSHGSNGSTCGDYSMDYEDASSLVNELEDDPNYTYSFVCD